MMGSMENAKLFSTTLSARRQMENLWGNQLSRFSNSSYLLQGPDKEVLLKLQKHGNIFIREAVGDDWRHPMGMIYDDISRALARPDPPQNVDGRMSAARDSLFLTWMSTPRQLTGPLHAMLKKALSPPLMSDQCGGYSSPSSRKTNDGWSSSDWYNGRDSNGGKIYGSGKYKNKNSGGYGDGYKSGPANSNTTQQIMGTHGTIVREKIQAREKQTALQNLREAFPAKLAGLITPAIQQQQQQQQQQRASSRPPNSPMQHSSDLRKIAHGMRCHARLRVYVSGNLSLHQVSGTPIGGPDSGAILESVHYFAEHNFDHLRWRRFAREIGLRCTRCDSEDHCAILCPTNPERPTGENPIGGPRLHQQPQQKKQQQQPLPLNHEPNCFKYLKTGHGAKDCPGNQQTGKTTQVHSDSSFENSRRVRKNNRSVEETNFVDELRPLVRTRTEMQKPRAVGGQSIGTRRPDAWRRWCSQQEELMPNHLPQVRCNIVTRRPALRGPERPPILPWDGRVRRMVWPVRAEETRPVEKPERACSIFARFVSLAFIEGTSLSVAIHGKKAAAWVDMVNGKLVDRETYIGVFTAVAKIGEALLPFLLMRCIIGGLMTSISSSPSLPAAGPAMQRMEPRQRWELECSLSCRTPGTAFTGLNLFVVLLGGARATNVYIYI